jgi:hypothetical protein
MLLMSFNPFSNDLLPPLKLLPAVAVDGGLPLLRMFLRSLDSTLSELPVDNFVIVTDPDVETGGEVLVVVIDGAVEEEEEEEKEEEEEEKEEEEEVEEEEEAAVQCLLEVAVESLVEEEDLTGDIVTLLSRLLDAEAAATEEAPPANSLPMASSTLSNVAEDDFSVGLLLLLLASGCSLAL